jgi:hypothetical protein
LKKTHITLVVDRSGSMLNIADEASGAINEYVRDQLKEPDGLTLTLIQFDGNHIDTVFGPASATQFTEYKLEPRGMTPLLDAIGKGITDTDSFLKSLDNNPDQPEVIIFVVITDGQENCSREFTKDKIAKMITDRTNIYGWDFVYLSSDFNAFSDANAYGFSSVNTAKVVADSGISYRNSVATHSVHSSNLRSGIDSTFAMAAAASNLSGFEVSGESKKDEDKKKKEEANVNK